ncbi:MAG TPA: hypothetical protein VGR74_17045 [Actinomycetota bacterium]|jgi:hypothetical protein|nr:hypothetical protein [Actinomycetota bacterium]
MRHTRRWNLAALLLVAALALGVSACSRGQGAGEEGDRSDAVKVEPVKGTELSRVILSQQAADRLGIQTAKVREAKVAAAGGGGAVTRKVIPYGAVLYDEQGETWTFTNPDPLTFLRQKISVDYVHGDDAVLSAGPAVGVTVVTVGSAELLGAELGVGEE